MRKIAAVFGALMAVVAAMIILPQIMEDQTAGAALTQTGVAGFFDNLIGLWLIPTVAVAGLAIVGGLTIAFRR